MIRLIQTELWKLRRCSIIWTGIATMLFVVLLTCFMEVASLETPVFAGFSDEVLWNNFSLIFPAAMVLIAGYSMERERTDDTLKSIACIPVSFRRLLAGKVLVCGLLAVFLAVIQLLFTLLMALILHYEEITGGAVLKALVQMVGMNCCLLVSVLPIIIFTGQRAGTFLQGAAFAFFYGFIGTFASGHGLGSLYPVTIGLGLINYQDGLTAGDYQLLSCVAVLALLLLVSGIMLASARDRGGLKQKR